ncbi:MAG TPA: UDP-N-acetylmuramoyl-tripeptide--D-alanyl-D-alanine ligase [Candidatus Magasanikbacteria bacterium]|nr:UDP-N-acetylmuramoyl-tripeptide--D-alanyl-D-alanine ligase [Candidatus Magasanikbacteria bacterium]
MKKLLQKILAKKARKILEKYKPKVIGVTGSMGKTTTKEMVVEVLSTKFRVRGNVGSYNNELGVPLTIIGAGTQGKSIFGWLKVFRRAQKLLSRVDSEYPEVLVLEMAADHEGDIKYLTEIAPCNVGIVTAVAPTHLEFFKTVEKVAVEKSIMVKHLQKNGVAILNRDDARVWAMRDVVGARVISFGYADGSDVRASEPGVKYAPDGSPEGLLFKIEFGGAIVPVYVPGVIGAHLANAAMCATATGIALGMNLVEIAAALRNVATAPGRMRIVSGIKYTTIIDDSYNSSPEAALAGMKTVGGINLRSGAERYAVLGDMLELGEYTREAHRRIGMAVVENKFDFVIFVGPAMVEAAEAARMSGMEEHRMARFDTAFEAGKFLQDKLEEGDIVYVKGSRGMHLEKVVYEVMADPDRAGEMIVWKKV